MLQPEPVEAALAGRQPPVCRNDRCRIDLARALQAKRLVDAHFRAEADGYGVTLFLFNAEIGQRSNNVARFCRRCGPDGLRQLLPEAARELDRGEPEIPAGQLLVRTVPPGAKIYLDGRALGQSNAELPAPAGWHTLRLEKPGFADAEMRVEVSLWQPSRAHVALAPLGGTSRVVITPAPVPGHDDGGRRHRLRPWAYAAVAAGVAAIAVGAVVLSRSGEPACALEGTARQCPELRGGRTTGIALLATGAAVTAGGAGLLIYDLHHARARLALAPTGAALTLSWR